MSADDLLPVACFVFCNSNMKRPRQTVAYIQVGAQRSLYLLVFLLVLLNLLSVE